MAMKKLKLLQDNFRPKAHKRILMLSVPKKDFLESDGMPKYTKLGIRQSAVSGRLRQNTEIAWPYLRRLMILKRMYKNTFSPERLQVVDRLIEAANSTMYSKLANCTIDLKKNESAKETRKKKSWSSSDWKKHTEYLSQIARSKKVFEPPPVPRGKSMPLEALQPRIDTISILPDFKCYRRMSKEEFYKDPEKVSRSALKYVITDRIKKLAEPRVYIEEN